ncbi:PD-(D/E)XK nuclease family transposase [Chondromyces apiculatus]|uniref:PD-(D/E)XK nuclease family transposase n=1 Tax=Chondromyces apiculatus TaxID=51 RepID=UPI0018CC1D83|nr:PD-(D/E)XK nuclease family transposase [Chondromyces apiculatus]
MREETVVLAGRGAAGRLPHLVHGGNAWAPGTSRTWSTAGPATVGDRQHHVHFAKRPDILAVLLNDLLDRQGERTIESIEYLPPQQLPLAAGAKLSILDVRCRDRAGTTFVVEMQLLHVTEVPPELPPARTGRRWSSPTSRDARKSPHSIGGSRAPPRRVPQQRSSPDHPDGAGAPTSVGA